MGSYRSIACQVGVTLGLIFVISLMPLSQGHAADDDLALAAPSSPGLERKIKGLGDRLRLVFSRHERSLLSAANDCGEGARDACRLADWQDFVSSLGSEPENQKILAVHRYVNSARFIPDARNWERPDYWAIPKELFGRGGDCEDYVIAKYLSLRRLGIPTHRLRIVVVYDASRREDHAVLAVESGEETLVLDNHYRRVRTWETVREDYKPYYSLNEDAVWIHRDWRRSG